jgi:protein-disulfide isomerase
MLKRIITWAVFIVVIGLIVWGMIVAEKRKSSIPTDAPDTLPTEVTEADWIFPNATSTAKFTIVEYSDFQCPACSAYFPLVEQLIREGAGDVRLVYRHFPLPQHKNAVLASRASEAAGKQGDFWGMYRLIFENQKEWENLPSDEARTMFISYADKLSLNKEVFETDMDSKEIGDKITEMKEVAAKSGINSTPTFYVNGKRIDNPSGYEEFKKLISEPAQ